uniref:Protein JTB n=1 Tax=Myotis myotis TaxID=51298 RepID=A0A7J7SRW2_MYOMY|nr:hypothetical protein mMyoMyo1_009366 [Myotis myotis]
MPAGAGRRGLPPGRRLCWLLCAFTLKLCQAEAPVREEKLSVSTSGLPCWMAEEFVVAEECTPCSTFQAKTTPECGSTGYVEKITCSLSKRNGFKRCCVLVRLKQREARGRGCLAFPGNNCFFLPSAVARR